MKMQHFVGIDIGGTNVKLGVVAWNDTARILRQISVPIVCNTDGRAIVAQLVTATRTLIDQCGVRIAGVGVGCPGHVGHNGKVHKSPNIPGLAGCNLQDKLTAELDLPVAVQNDANAAVLGEWRFGPNRNLKNLILLTLGTGIGAGVIADGKLLQGADNAAAELGHLKVEFGGETCGCGRKGCLEAYVGAAGIVRIAKRHLATGEASSLSEPFDTKAIADAAGAGDEVAQQILYEVGAYLARGVAMLVDIFNPEMILFGGGASAAYKHFYPPPGIKAILEKWVSFPTSLHRVRLRQVKRPGTINILGAAATVVDG